METMYFKLQDLVIKVVISADGADVEWNGYKKQLENTHKAIAFVEARGGQLIIDKWE